MKIKKVCSECGSEDVLVDAYASWNYGKQKYELDSTYDNTFCNNCGGECSINEIEITE